MEKQISPVFFTNDLLIHGLLDVSRYPNLIFKTLKTGHLVYSTMNEFKVMTYNFCKGINVRLFFLSRCFCMYQHFLQSELLKIIALIAYRLQDFFHIRLLIHREIKVLVGIQCISYCPYNFTYDMALGNLGNDIWYQIGRFYNIHSKFIPERKKAEEFEKASIALYFPRHHFNPKF